MRSIRKRVVQGQQNVEDTEVKRVNGCHASEPRRQFEPLVYWYLTFRCNLVCKHCWVRSGPDASTEKDLSTDDLIGVCDKLVTLTPKRVILSGGEPLLREDIDALLKALIERHMAFSVETNGLLLTDRVISLFADALGAGLSCEITVSLDGGDARSHEWVRGDGTFEIVLRSIRRLGNAGIPFGINCVVSRNSLHSLPRVFEIACGRGTGNPATHLSLNVVRLIGRASDSPNELQMGPDEYLAAFVLIADNAGMFRGHTVIRVPPGAVPLQAFCRLRHHGNVSFMTTCDFPLIGILPDGTLSICALTAGQADLTLGHALTDDLRSILTESLVPLRWSYEKANLSGICGDCVFRTSCKGGCRALALQAYGRFDASNPICEELNQTGRFADTYRVSPAGSLP